mgnify:FL=1
MNFIFYPIVALLVTGLFTWLLYCYTYPSDTRGGNGRNAQAVNTFSNVCIAVEPELGQIRLPNATDPKFRAELKAENGDTITIADVIVKDNGADREFVFDLIYDFGKGLTQIKTLRVSTKYSELPVKYDYLQPGKWTLWVKREDQRK